MKVGLVSFHSFINPGGVKRHILGLFKEFKKRGIDVKIIAPRRKLSENYGKNVILLGTSFPLKFSGSQADFNINFNPLAIEATLKKEKFDVLHLHNVGLPSSLQILLSPAAVNTLNILTFHANIKGNEVLENIPSFKYILGKLCQWKIDGVIGVAPLVIDYFEHYNGLKKVIPNGIDLDEFNTRALRIEKFCDSKTNILFVGRIEERKGLIYLIKAFEILEKKSLNLRLIIVGTGPLKKECERYIKEKKIKNIVFEGEVTEGIASYYRTADIFVSPAIFGESFGLVLLEAMACGAPVAAFSNQGYASFLKGKVAEKFMAKPRDYQGLAEKIEILINNPRLREEISKKGILEAERYSWVKVSDQILDFYDLCKKEVAKKKSANRRKKTNHFF